MLLFFTIVLISPHFCTIADFCWFFFVLYVLLNVCLNVSFILCPHIYESYFLAHTRMRTFWRSCSGYRLGADRTYRHIQLWQSVKRPPCRVCSVSLTKFDFFFRPALQFSVLCVLYTFPTYVWGPWSKKKTRLERKIQMSRSIRSPALLSPFQKSDWVCL